VVVVDKTNHTEYHPSNNTKGDDLGRIGRERILSSFRIV
jgi:hypothetical protein